MPTLPPTTPTPTAPVFRDTTVVRNFRTGTPEGFRPRLNTDLGLSLSTEAYLHIQTHFKNTAFRDPTVGELRLLDALLRNGAQSPDRIAVGELTTQSSAIADTWADMMLKHGTLHGAFDAFRGDPGGTPPCTLSHALTLTGRYLRRTGRPAEEDTLVLSAPFQEAMATAQGYAPVARVALDHGVRSVWRRKQLPFTAASPRTGDFILYLPQASLRQVQALVSAEAEKSRPLLGDLRAVAQKSLLLTLLELCPAADLHTDRLPAAGAEGGRVPVERLCTSPAVRPDGVCAYLLRVPFKQVQPMNERLNELGISAIPFGQVRTGGNLVILVKDPDRKREVPAVTLSAGILRSMASIRLYTMRPSALDVPPAMPVFPAMSRLPSVVYSESGLTPDGNEAVGLTLHEGRVLRVPEADLLMTALTTEIPCRDTAFRSAADTVAATARQLADLDMSPDTITLTVTVTAASVDILTDGTALAAICGIYNAAAQLALPVEDSIIEVAPTDGLLRVTVTAWGRNAELCAETARTEDNQWHTSAEPVSKESSAYILPVLRRSYEDSLKALASALNRDHGVRCIIRPLAMKAVPVIAEAGEATEAVPAAETRYIPDEDGVKQLAEQLLQWNTPIFAMSEADTRLLLSEPAIENALRHLTDLGYSILVLGESCKVFAEWGLLPDCLLRTQKILPEGDRATVTYAFPAEPTTRLLRVGLTAPAESDTAADHILDLHLPDGRVIPDGFIGRGGKVLGLTNGLDPVILTRIRGNVFSL